jgi:hypothetical protein
MGKNEQDVVLHCPAGGGSKRNRLVDSWLKPIGEAGGRNARSSSGVAAPNERASLDQRHVTLKGKDFSMQSFDGHELDQRVLMVNFEALLRRIDQEHDVLSGKGQLDRVGLLVDINAAIGADAAREGLPVNAL